MNDDETLTQIHRKAVNHLLACAEAFYAEQNGDTEVKSPAVAPFCGCDDCVVREILVIAWTDLIAGAVCYIEENVRDQEAVNRIYARALRRIANGETPNPAMLAQMTLGEGGGEGLG